MFFFTHKCPSCKKVGHKVDHHTMIHHVKDISKIRKERYAYCSSSECDIVYYDSNNEIFTTSMINKEIGFKSSSSDKSAICFCYNYLKTELMEPQIIDKINIRLNSYGSRCDIRNPSGKCCLQDIKKIHKD